jgi:putative ABC transport system permease protein
MVVTRLRSELRAGRAATIDAARSMNLAYRDIKHNLLRFVLTNFGLSLLLGIVIVITGVYGGLIDDALRQARAAMRTSGGQAGTNGPFAESRAFPATPEVGQPSLWRGTRRLGHLSIGPDRPERQAAPPLPHRLRAGPARRPPQLLAGRDILRSHYEMIVDRSAGRARPEVPLGTRGTVHGRRPYAQ